MFNKGGSRVAEHYNQEVKKTQSGAVQTRNNDLPSGTFRSRSSKNPVPLPSTHVGSSTDNIPEVQPASSRSNPAPQEPMDVDSDNVESEPGPSRSNPSNQEEAMDVEDVESEPDQEGVSILIPKLIF